MVKPSLDKFRGSKAPSVTELVAETRIDQAHPAAGSVPGDSRAGESIGRDGGINLEMLEYGPALAPSPTPEVSGELLLPEASANGAQATIQAAQLAEHLRGRQQELDHREAELNAWAAKLDRDARAARLWFEERQAALDEAETEPGTIVLQDEAIQRKAEELAERERQLAELDAELAAQREALQKFHEQLTTERQLLEEQSRRAEGAFDDRGSPIGCGHREAARRDRAPRRTGGPGPRRAGAVPRGAWPHASRNAGDSPGHRGAVGGTLRAAPPAALTQSLGRIRGRLADHYRRASAEVQQKRDELQQLRDQLSEQYEKLVRQKRSFDAWAAECREEVELQSARLQARGEELDRREADMGEYARAAQAEKLGLQEEIRRLRAKLMSRAKVELPA